MSTLRAAIIVDYQNVHLTGHGLFASTRYLPKHETTVREAQDPANDLVILASSDSDLAPAIDEVQRLGCAKVETFCWYDSVSRICYQLHPTDRARPVWNTRLDERAFRASWDLTDYR